MDTGVGAHPHLRDHLNEDLLVLARRESRSEPKDASMLPLRTLLSDDALARDSAANIMNLTGCSLRDIERIRHYGVGVGVLERFVVQRNRLPTDVSEFASFIKEASRTQE